jgi:hypothetical protein
MTIAPVPASEYKDYACRACGGLIWGGITYEPARKEWRLFGKLLRPARGEHLRIICKTCWREETHPCDGTITVKQIG